MALLPARSCSGRRGQALLEYAALVAVIGVCLVAVIGLLGRATQNAYQRTANTVATGGGPAGMMGGDVGLGVVHVIPAGARPPRDSTTAAADSTGETGRKPR